MYQVITIGGYNKLVEGLLDGIEIRSKINFFEEKEELDPLAEKVLYTGKIDEFFDCKLGKLEYRSLHFETEVLDEQNYQGNAVVNYTEKEIPYTRILEYKHFESGTQDKTVVIKDILMSLVRTMNLIILLMMKETIIF